ncbi:MAG: hypothetical protein EOO88_57875 [Pedobacter sp.]|nr:MAG: hypothetical protein EOO88_57875 [Pedobacter sp.]
MLHDIASSEPAENHSRNSYAQKEANESDAGLLDTYARKVSRIGDEPVGVSIFESMMEKLTTPQQ